MHINKLIIVFLFSALCLGCSKQESPVPSAQAVTVKDTNALSDSSLIKKYEAGRCKAITKKGEQCKRRASKGSDYCWQHQPETKP